MGRYFFGVGTGRLSQTEIAKRTKAAKKHGADFVCRHGGNNGQCVCGHGCRLDSCRVLSYHFVAPNRGEPFDSAVKAAVEAELS